MSCILNYILYLSYKSISYYSIQLFALFYINIFNNYECSKYYMSSSFLFVNFSYSFTKNMSCKISFFILNMFSITKISLMFYILSNNYCIVFLSVISRYNNKSNIYCNYIIYLFLYLSIYLNNYYRFCIIYYYISI